MTLVRIYGCKLSVSFIVSLKVRIFPLNMHDVIIYIAQWWEKYLSKRSPLKHTCSWRDKLIIWWILNRQAKIFYVIHTLLKRSRLKWTFLRLLSAQVKICQIPYVNFETTIRSIPLQILYPSSVSWKITPLYFLAQTVHTLLKKSLLKWNFLRHLSQNLSNSLFMSVFKQQVDSSPNFVSLFNFMKDNSSALF